MNPETPHEPTPEMLAAYADGELEPATRETVRDWLAQHLEAQSELDANQHLARFCQNAPLPEPTEAAWNTALANIHARVTPRRPRSLRRVLSWAVGLAATAALILLIVQTASRRSPFNLTVPDGPTAVLDSPIESLPVASDKDVIITSFDEADRGLFVVGDLPLQDEPLVLASQGDVRVEQIVPDEGMNLEFLGEDSTVPMFRAFPRNQTPSDKKP